MTSEDTWHMANIWEVVSKAVPDSEAIVYEDRRLTWAEYENQAARMAQVFVDSGLKPGAKVSIYSYNSVEYLVAQFAAFKARLCPVNVNYRYLETELAHVINNSDSEAIVFQAEFAPRLAAIRDQLDQVKLFLEVDDKTNGHLEGSKNFADEIVMTEPMPIIERSGDDIYMLYTGGTTGLPKGVMYDHKTLSKALMTKSMRLRGLPLPNSPKNLIGAVKAMAAKGLSPRCMPACPLMHGTGVWVGVVIPHGLGGSVVLFDNHSFDADHILDLIQTEKVQEIVIVGDVFARPIAAALDEAAEAGRPYDTSSMKMVNSSGVMFSSENKAKVLKHMDVTIFDSMGSTEGSIGVSIGNRASMGTDQTARFMLAPTSKVLTEDGREIQPGSGEIGMLCNGSMVPLGYYKDEEKSAKTFRTFNGVRYSVPGDFAILEADGTITLLGRGSTCINSGGEKIFPEEVEEALKTQANIYDCLVVGVPDEKFGQAVTAVFSTIDGQTIDAATLKTHTRGLLADYKAPRHFVRTDLVPRADNGKANYKAAKSLAMQTLNLDE